MNYTVKQLADMMDLSEHTLRYYTDMGLLPCGRDNANRRVFDEDSVNWVTGIKCMRKCGMSIEAIKTYSDLCMAEDSPENMRARAEIILSQQNVAHERLREAQEIADYMDRKVAHYEAILAGTIADDSNPNRWKDTPPKKC